MGKAIQLHENFFLHNRLNKLGNEKPEFGVVRNTSVIHKCYTWSTAVVVVIGNDGNSAVVNTMWHL